MTDLTPQEREALMAQPRRAAQVQLSNDAEWFEFWEDGWKAGYEAAEAERDAFQTKCEGWEGTARQTEVRAENAEAERDRLAARVAELEQKPYSRTYADKMEARVAELEEENKMLAEGVDANYSLLCERDEQLQQATEAMMAENVEIHLREMKRYAACDTRLQRATEAHVMVRSVLADLVGYCQAAKQPMTDLYIEGLHERANKAALAALAGEDDGA